MNCDKIGLESFHLLMALVLGQKKKDVSAIWGKRSLCSQCH